MSLSRFFEAIAPTLLGETSAAQAASRLGVDPSRLAIYERFCRVHRFEAIEGVFPHCKAAVASDAWSDLVEGYFRRHPMTHVELNTNAAQWPQFLAEEVASRGLPAWLPELADFEWWEWQTLVAPDDAGDPDAGPLRVSPTVELRPYAHDLVGWIEQGREGEPEAAQTLVLFWREREGGLRREVASQDELLVLKSVATGEALPDALLEQLGLDRDELEETTQDLHAAGILIGALPDP